MATSLLTPEKYEQVFTPNGDVAWHELLKIAIEAYVTQNRPKDAGVEYDEHTKDTPKRVVKAFAEYVSGCAENPARHLEKTFTACNYDEMIHIPDIRLVSMCMHHLAPIVGKIHFAYIPDQHVVGLSKVPRFIEDLARRPQVQELLTVQIANVFQQELAPQGCGVHVRAYHFCMCGRGVQEPAAYTATTALRGSFKSNATRQEFLQALDRDSVIFP